MELPIFDCASRGRVHRRRSRLEDVIRSRRSKKAHVPRAEDCRLRELTSFQRARFEDGDDFQLQRLMEPSQLAEFLLFAEIQARPALTQDEAMRVIRDLSQCPDVAVVFRLIDGAGELLVSFELVRQVGETVRVKQFDQFLPEPGQLGFILNGQPLLPGHGCGPRLLSAVCAVYSLACSKARPGGTNENSPAFQRWVGPKSSKSRRDG